MFRKGTQTPPNRLYHQADGQRFRISRSMPEASFRPGLVSHSPHPEFWRDGTCEEADCPSYLRGWVTTLNMDPSQGDDEVAMNQLRYRYIKEQSGREFTENVDEFTISLTFPPGQPCFSTHRVPIERDPMFIISSGRSRRAVDYDEFFDRFNETTYLLEKRRESG